MYWSKKKNRSCSFSRCATLEALESRKVFAGNVLVAYNAATGSTLLTGDLQSNTVEVSPFAGGIRVQGQLGTTVNGAAAVFLPVVSLGNVSVKLLDGDDSISVTDIYMANFNLQETVGADNVNLNRVRVASDVVIDTRADNDLINVNGLFQGNVTINSGTHDDQVKVSGKIGVLLIGGGGQLDDGYVFGGALGGNKNLTIDTGSGNDSVSLVSLDVDGTALINTGANNDNFRSQDVRVADRLQLDTLGGADLAFFQTTECAIVNVDMGAGNDELHIDAFTLAHVGFFTLDGGLGVDLLDRGGLLGGLPVNFEILI